MNRTRQIILAVFGIRAVPLHACVVKAPADIRRHRHETTVRAISWHTLVLRLIGEVNLCAVRVRRCPCHPVVTFIEEDERFFHGFHALGGIGYAGVDHVLLGQPD